MTLDELFLQAAQDSVKYAGIAEITVKATVKTVRWLAGIPGEGGLEVLEPAVGTLTYRPGHTLSSNQGEIFFAPSFTGQLTNEIPVSLIPSGVEQPYFYSLTFDMYAVTPSDFGAAITLLRPVVQPGRETDFPIRFPQPEGVDGVSFQFSDSTKPVTVFITIDSYSVRKVLNPPILIELIGTLMSGGVAVDSGGSIVIGGVKIPVGPWIGSKVPLSAVSRELLIGLATTEMAKFITDPSELKAINTRLLSGATIRMKLNAKRREKRAGTGRQY